MGVSDWSLKELKKCLFLLFSLPCLPHSSISFCPLTSPPPPQTPPTVAMYLNMGLFVHTPKDLMNTPKDLMNSLNGHVPRLSDLNKNLSSRLWL